MELRDAKTAWKNASTFAYQYLKPRRFLRERIDGNRIQLDVFGKWEDSDPDQFDFKKYDGGIHKLNIEPLQKFIIDKNKKIFYQDNQTEKTTRLFFHDSWYTASTLQNEVATIIGSYLDFYKVFDNRGKFGRERTAKAAVEAKKVFAAKFGHSLPVLKRIIGGRIWHYLDNEAAKLAIKIGSNKASSYDYTLIANNLDEVKDTLNKAPGILPFWLGLVKHTDKFGRIIFNPDANFKFPNIIELTKEWLTKEGLTPRGWKYLVKLKPAWSRRFLNRSSVANFSDNPNADFIDNINFFSRVDGVPRLTLMKNLVNFGFVERHDIEFYQQKKEAFLRAIINHTKKLTGIKYFWDTQASLVADWIKRDPTPFDRNQLNAPWSWYLRKQAEWHELMQLKKRESVKQTKWDAVIEPFSHKGYEVVPLTSALELYDEGKDMHHCVGGYSDLCMEGKSHIYSIRKNEMKVATAEIRFLDKWTMNQCRGKSNEDVDDKVKEVANEILKNIAMLFAE